MSEIKPKVGERWRFTGEGVVTAVWEITSEEPFVQIEIDKHCTWNIPLKNVPMERLPDPEPEWKPGDLVMDAYDRVLKRRDPDHGRADEYPWYFVNAGDWGTEADARRPLRRLVIEGE